MKICFKPTQLGLIPAFEQDYESYKKIKNKEFVEADFKEARNIMFHRKFMALIKLVYENLNEQDIKKYSDFNKLRKAITIAAGYFELQPLIDGTEQIVAKSIAFEKMDNFEFEKLYNSTIDVILKEFFAGVDKQNLVDEIINFL